MVVRLSSLCAVALVVGCGGSPSPAATPPAAASASSPPPAAPQTAPEPAVPPSASAAPTVPETPGSNAPDATPAPTEAAAEPPRQAEPDVVPGTAEVRGTLDKDLIRRIVRRHLHELKACYQKALANDPKLHANVQVELTIGATGAVAAVTMRTGSGVTAFDQCISDAVRRWQFPRPQGGIVIVTYPFSFASK